MLVWVWVGLAAGAGATLASLVFVVVRGLRTWRLSKAAFGAIGESIDDVSVRVEHFARQVQAASGHAERVGAAAAQLRQSRARLNVLLQAIDEVRDALTSVRAFVPRKG